MTVTLALEWFRHLLWTAILTAGPVIFTIVVIGLLIAIVQAATQINDGALAFGPKALVIVVVMVVAGPWMFEQITEFTEQAIQGMGNIKR